MSSETRQLRLMLVSALASALPYSVPTAFAEGGLGQQSEAAITINASGEGFALNSTTGGVASTGYLSSGVKLWDTTTVKTTTSSDVSVTSNSYAVSALKGTNSIAVGQAITTVSVVINGKACVVAKEIATALARSGQFGSSAYVDVQGSVASQGNGYSTTSVTTSKSGR